MKFFVESATAPLARAISLDFGLRFTAVALAQRFSRQHQTA